MLTPPDPMCQQEFNDSMYTSMCSSGIQTHDNSISGRYHNNGGLLLNQVALLIRQNQYNL